MGIAEKARELLRAKKFNVGLWPVQLQRLLCDWRGHQIRIEAIINEHGQETAVLIAKFKIGREYAIIPSSPGDPGRVVKREHPAWMRRVR